VGGATALAVTFLNDPAGEISASALNAVANKAIVTNGLLTFFIFVLPSFLTQE
jgi:hypothetical protein